MQRLQPISCPNDLSDYLDLYGVNITEPQRKALGKFWGFLQIRKGKTSINGYPIALYIANLKIAEKGASRMATQWLPLALLVLIRNNTINAKNLCTL
ncbi:hypothetical protein J5991_07035, partial [Methanocorpusculum sp.]|nr:hypothetical protein [Methanocorpusculum sp.]